MILLNIIEKFERINQFSLIDMNEQKEFASKEYLKTSAEQLS